MEQSGFIKDNGRVVDGADVTNNCTSVNNIEWSSNSGILLSGAAVMYNTTKGAQVWRDRINKVLNHSTTVFFKDGVMQETACETNGKCDSYQRFFKGLYAINLARTVQAAPFTNQTITTLLKKTAPAAAAGCDDSGASCQLGWVPGGTAGPKDIGAQFSVLQAVQSNLLVSSKGVTGQNQNTSTGGGSSNSNGNGNGTSNGSNGGTTSGAMATHLGGSVWKSLPGAILCALLFGVL